MVGPAGTRVEDSRLGLPGKRGEGRAAVVWDYCVPRRLPFKFVPSLGEVHLRNTKYADRGSSGKFATVYPVDEQELHRTLKELGDLLEGEPGPYILSDLRWNDGPLYVRYGAFARRYCTDPDGDRHVPAIEAPGGTMVPDRRGPVFHVPDWVQLPDFLVPQLAARSSLTLEGLPYRIEGVLHYSNGGGVYAGTDSRSGEQVVLKEARPYAGLAADGSDAVSRLEREKTALERLDGLSVAPSVLDWFTLGGHRFLVMEYLEGSPLNSFFARRHPLLRPEPDPEAVADYTRWALRMHEAVAAVHSRGIVFNDRHPFNIMVTPDESGVRLMDFEAAAHIDEQRKQVVAHPGYVAPADREGFDIDRYALACLRLGLFIPMTTVLAVDRPKAAHLAEIVCAQFPVERSWLDEAVDVIAGCPTRTRKAASAGEEKRRGTAGDAGGYVPVAPATGPPAGPRWSAPSWPRPPRPAMTVSSPATSPSSPTAGASVSPMGRPASSWPSTWRARRATRGEQWLLRHAGRPARGTPLGVYDGLAGVAYVLDRLGHTDRAMSLILALLKKQWQQLPAPAPHHGGRRHLDRRPHRPRAGHLEDVRLLHPRQRSRQGDGLRSEPHRDCSRRGEGHPAPDTRPPPRAAN